jgi:predicted HicB family RNase H-like nuclease
MPRNPNVVDFKFRIDKGTHKKLAAAAKKNRRSLNSEMAERVEGSFEERERASNNERRTQAELYITFAMECLKDIDLKELRRGGELMDALFTLAREIQQHLPEHIWSESLKKAMERVDQEHARLLEEEGEAEKILETAE